MEVVESDGAVKEVVACVVGMKFQIVLDMCTG